MKTLKEMVLSAELVYCLHVGGIGRLFTFAIGAKLEGKENGKHSMSQFNFGAEKALHLKSSMEIRQI